ncbi:uncharacterized protein LOC134290551 [Aedes albopictus]|uniref:Ubiquitin-like domain-containing protein n=1 Tax=Aedes albopictus TaxID=7160 RepID=A0ABM1ZML2_AEDAL
MLWTPSYEIIVETLTGSEFEVTAGDRDTVGYIKSKIQKYEGIPVNQQHLLYNHKELSDTMEMKDIPLVISIRRHVLFGVSTRLTIAVNKCSAGELTGTKVR